MYEHTAEMDMMNMVACRTASNGADRQQYYAVQKIQECTLTLAGGTTNSWGYHQIPLHVFFLGGGVTKCQLGVKNQIARAGPTHTCHIGGNLFASFEG